VKSTEDTFLWEDIGFL